MIGKSFRELFNSERQVELMNNGLEGLTYPKGMPLALRVAWVGKRRSAK